MPNGLTVVIPARNEIFLQRTLDDLLAAIEADTDIIVVLDGYWPAEPIPNNPRVTLIHHTQPVGQRAATNEGARLSQAKYIMKCDAHCAFDKGFDRKLIDAAKTLGDDVTQIPRMYNLHAFDWECKACGDRTYQSPTPAVCLKCQSTDIHRAMVWKPRLARKTDFARFDRTLHFQYWRQYNSRPEAQPDIADVMCSIGACWFMSRARFWELGGVDEAHGSWGQYGVEVACKSWLSGGRQVVNKKTWFSHMFRTQGGDFGFPYKITNGEIDHARTYSRDLWMNNKWPKAIRKLDWLIEKFAPVPDWHPDPFDTGVPA